MMPQTISYFVLFLMLVVSCEFKDMHWRKLPEEKDVAFEGKTKVPDNASYRPGKAKDIHLHLTSNDEEAKEARFKILSAKIADGSNADLDYDSLKLGNNTLHYQPQEPGTHELTLKVAVEGEEASEKTFHYTVEAPAAAWKGRGSADTTGPLTIQIEDVPEELQGESWRITNTTFSEGLEGDMSIHLKK